MNDALVYTSCANTYGTYNMEKYELSEYSWDCSSNSTFNNNYIVDGLLVRNHLCFANHKLGDGQNMRIYKPKGAADSVKINKIPVVIFEVVRHVPKGPELSS